MTMNQRNEIEDYKLYGVESEGSRGPYWIMDSLQSTTVSVWEEMVEPDSIDPGRWMIKYFMAAPH